MRIPIFYYTGLLLVDQYSDGLFWEAVMPGFLELPSVDYPSTYTDAVS